MKNLEEQQARAHPRSVRFQVACRKMLMDGVPVNSVFTMGFTAMSDRGVFYSEVHENESQVEDKRCDKQNPSGAFTHPKCHIVKSQDTLCDNTGMLKDFVPEPSRFYAAIYGYHDMLRFLVEMRGDAGVQNQEGRSALHWAARNGHVECARLLVRPGKRGVTTAGVLNLHRGC